MFILEHWDSHMRHLSPVTLTDGPVRKNMWLLNKAFKNMQLRFFFSFFAKGQLLSNLFFFKIFAVHFSFSSNV